MLRHQHAQRHAKYVDLDPRARAFPDAPDLDTLARVPARHEQAHVVNASLPTVTGREIMLTGRHTAKQQRCSEDHRNHLDNVAHQKSLLPVANGKKAPSQASGWSGIELSLSKEAIGQHNDVARQDHGLWASLKLAVAAPDENGTSHGAIRKSPGWTEHILYPEAGLPCVFVQISAAVGIRRPQGLHQSAARQVEQGDQDRKKVEPARQGTLRPA